jgi:hypothetical protein
VYARSLIVVALCTIFVLAFALVLGYETAGVGNPGTTLVTTQTSCSAFDASCESLTITSSALRTVNYTDELGTVEYSNLTMGLTPHGPSPVSSLTFFVGNQSAGRIQGPFNPGTNRFLNLTLPETIPVSHGKTYVVTVEGDYGNGLTAWTSARVTAE